MNEFTIPRVQLVQGHLPESLYMTFINLAIEKYGSLDVAVMAACILLLKKEGIEVADKYLETCGCQQ